MTALAALGIDAGSATTKLIGVDAAGAMIWHLEEASHPRIEEQAARLLDRVRAELGRLDAVPIIGTGYGRRLLPGVSRAVTEISCHAKGAFAVHRRPGTLVDIGGQDSKVIHVGEGGTVGAFQMNDKCAAGTGRFLEVVAARLGLDLDRLSEAALATTDEAAISSTCTVFAESEMISLLARGTALEPMVRGLHRALVRRVVALVRTLGARPPLLMSGGVARSRAVVVLLGEELGSAITVGPHPQLTGALGAALFGLEQAGRAGSSASMGA
jgi:predicted CoA-substrate-specific enzyme activase